MNVKMLNKVKEQIRQEPKSFDMNDWLRPGVNRGGTACGTAACVAGFTCVVDWMQKHPDEWKNKKEITLSEIVRGTLRGSYDCETEAINILGLTHEQANRLFYVDAWPEPFRTDYGAAQEGCRQNHYQTDHERRAQVSCARIDHFIKTGL